MCYVPRSDEGVGSIDRHVQYLKNYDYYNKSTKIIMEMKFLYDLQTKFYVKSE
jgi:hypothetical protein